MAQYTLDKFECEGEVGSVAIRWERWKRSLDIYLEAAGIDTDAKKRACLLHFGGPELQEIFYNIPGANAPIDDNNKDQIFGIAISKLDEYFAPKQSKIYERHVFRLLKQGPGEKFEKYLIRLRQQATKCQYTAKDENIIDQITEKCLSDDLRKKILKMGDNVTLDMIISEANALEVIERQLGHFENKTQDFQTVNKLTSEPNKNQYSERKPCGRCGSLKHFARDVTCPAKGKTCLKCGILGHFQNQCRTRQGQKRKEFDKGKGVKRFRQVNSLEETLSMEEQQTDYIFNLDSEATVNCKIGGVDTTMLIDSGCNYNLITDKTWKKLKENNIVVRAQNNKSNKSFVAYGCTTPLKLLGSFQAKINLSNKKKCHFLCCRKRNTKFTRANYCNFPRGTQNQC
ncbi:uncharacterized protein LOC119190445 [Manduca sexta]|uniref:uncharacterized protein LOC119190445 n=1 Tax=Manduca sexta TaxID=7130 RepID=UPI00188FCC70|nr:uncharacterized protein LOC119190445 [Manduca sexta]